MNIAFTYPVPFKPQNGGIERVVDELSREMKKRGHNIFYFHHRNEQTYGEYTPPAVASFSPSNDYKALESIKSYHFFLKKYEIDVVINNNGLWPDSSLYTNVNYGEGIAPIVISVCHNDPFLNYHCLLNQSYFLRNNTLIEHIKRIIRCFLYPWRKRKYLKERKDCIKFSLSHSDAILLLSNRYRASLKTLCEDTYDESKVFAIPNPLPSFKEDNASITAKKNWLLYVGRLSYIDKRPDRLLKIWRRIYHLFPEWELHIVGDGDESYRKLLEYKAKNLPRVYFEGQQNVTSFYAQSKILLLTSNYEGFGMVLIEAMERGIVPILFNSYAAAPDIVDDGKCGVLVSPFNIKEFAMKLTALMQNDDRRNEMARAAREKSRKYNVENIVDQWLNLIDKLIHNKRCHY